MDTSNGVIGYVGVIMSQVLATASEVSTEVQIYVSMICTALIAFVTCFLQIYRAIKGRDSEKTIEEMLKKNNEKVEEKEDENND